MGGFGDLLRAKGLEASAGAEEPPEADEAPDASDEIDLATVPKVVLRISRKGRGGRTVTLIQHVAGSKGARKRLARRLRKALGVGVSVDGDDLVAQGDQRERLDGWLREAGVRNVVQG